MDKLLINDIPLSDLGAVLAPDSYKSVLTWAKFKSIQSIDWAEHNFAEYDLSKPTLDKRTVTLNFHAKGEDGYTMFVEYLLQYVYAFYYFPELGITLRMRINTSSLNAIGGRCQSFAITFVDDEPYRQLNGVYVPQTFARTGFTIDGVDIADYGIAILKGTYKTILQKGAVKERLTINENSQDGALYDSLGDNKIKGTTFTVKCLLRAQNLSTAVANYYYLLEILKQSGTRRVHARPGGIFNIKDDIYVHMPAEFIDCFYNQCSVNAVHGKLASGNAGIAFDLTFTIVARGIVQSLANDEADTALITDTKLLYAETQN